MKLLVVPAELSGASWGNGVAHVIYLGRYPVAAFNRVHPVAALLNVGSLLSMV